MMKKIALSLSLVSAGLGMTLVTPRMALAQDTHLARPIPGKMLYSTNGEKLAPVYKVDASGAAVILMQGGVFTIPASTLTMADGKVATTMTKRQLFVR